MTMRFANFAKPGASEAKPDKAAREPTGLNQRDYE